MTYTVYDKDDKALAGDAMPVTQDVRDYADAHEGYIKDDATGAVIYPVKEA